MRGGSMGGVRGDSKNVGSDGRLAREGGTAEWNLPMKAFPGLKRLFSMLTEAAREWHEDNASRCAAALAYYAAVSVAPLIVLVLVWVTAVWGEDAASGRLTTYLNEMMGASQAGIFQEIIARAKQPVLGSWAGIVSLGVLLWGASNVFDQLQAALNQIWDAPPPDRIHFAHKVYKRAMSFVMVAAFGILLLASLALSTGVAALGSRLPSMGLDIGFLQHLMSALISFVAIGALVAAIYNVLPDVAIGWRNVLAGAALTALLLSIGKWALGMYLGHAGTSSAYGAAGSLVMFLLWVYYSAQIFFFGAEFTHVYARRSRNRHSPGGESVDKRVRLTGRRSAISPFSMQTSSSQSDSSSNDSCET